MNRWALYFDVEGTSKIYQSQEARFYAAFDNVLGTICRISCDAFPESPYRIFSHQVGGDGVLVVSEFAERNPERFISIGVILMQVLLANGFLGKAGVSVGTFADVQSCLPSTKSAQGLLTVFPVMGTALINSHRLAACNPRGARMAVDTSIMQMIPEGVVVSSREKAVSIVDWIHTETQTIQDILFKIGLKLPSQQDFEFRLKNYVQNSGQDTDREWKHNTLYLNGILPSSEASVKVTIDEYKKSFGILGEPEAANAKEALNLALDIRKFEIELYWKRATYFWAFLAVTLVAYFGVLVAKEIAPDAKPEALLVVSCLGLVFSVAWYFVNRASKFWQENWEKHVDLLEDAVIGPIYKTVLNDHSLSIWKWWAPYPFSVSKLNQILSLFVVLLFALLSSVTCYRYYRIGWPPDVLATSMILITITTIAALYWKGRTQLGTSNVSADRRTTNIV